MTTSRSVRFFFALAACAAAAVSAQSRGHLLLIGGGGEPDVVWTKFFELVGGKDSPLVVVPTASGEPETGPEYVADLKARGATDVVNLPIHSPEDAAKPENVAALARARGVFFTGGDQSRITRAFLGSPALAALRTAFENGAVLSGTSAGLACMSEVMITGEGDFTVVKRGAVETVTGLGFVKLAIVDQHFVTRQRLNRLLSAVLERPDLLGVGVDEMTAVWIKPDQTFEVLGESNVLVIDATGAQVESVAQGARQRARGVEFHVLAAGDVFDLARKRTP
jgi:cyanophycinase